jgi:8-oxo-dGTP pyrophosphatase MutT (NUDIX family)
MNICKEYNTIADYKECKNLSSFIDSSNYEYKCGAVIFNDALTKVLLVKNRQCHKWGFPKGSSLKNEDILSCAIREVREETGINLKTEGTIYNYFKLDRQHYFSVVLKDKVKFNIIDKNEISKVKFIPIKFIPELYSNINVKMFYKNYIENDCVGDLFKTFS